MSGRRFAYADPPYLGSAHRHYGELHPDAGAFDKPETHRLLVERLEADFPDGWALSLHVPSLRTVLGFCRPDVRIAAWVKPFSGARLGVRAKFAWEPVIYRTRLHWGWGPVFRDWLMANGQRTQDVPEVFPGRKPEAFSAWIADLLGYRAGDEIVDLFPGSGQVSRAFAKLRQRDPEQFRLEAVA